MNTTLERLANEEHRFLATLPELESLLVLERRIGRPASAYECTVQPFGLLVRVEGPAGFGEPVVYDPEVHGRLRLVFATDPERHPYIPWSVYLEAASRDLVVFNPHVGFRGETRGVVCWVEKRPDFQPARWPADRVLVHVLRILSGETVAFEGYALQEDAKVHFARHPSLLPFARVPEAVALKLTGPPAAPRRGASDLGIELGAGGPGR